MHAHWLVDARFVDQAELARTWGALVGQDYAIVKVIDAREKGGTIGGDKGLSPQSVRGNYQRELMKYVVKGSDLARWSPEEIQTFIQCVRSQRFFFCFGELFKVARRLRAELEMQKERQVCDCGCSQYIITSDESRRKWKAKRQRRS